MTLRFAAAVLLALIATPARAAVDADGDGFDSSSDCDDSNAAVNPAAAEVPDGLDNDCDGVVDEGGAGTDTDGDGYDPASGDCDDADATVHPGALEVCDGLDNDCDGRVDEDTPPPSWARDADGDGYGDPTATKVDCWQPAGYVADATDCDDTDATVHPGATEAEGDGVDSDCDGDDSTVVVDTGDTGTEDTDTGTADTDTGAADTADTGDSAEDVDTGDTADTTAPPLCATGPLAGAGALALAAVAVAVGRRRR